MTLSWTDDDDATRPHLAPMTLSPVPSKRAYNNGNQPYRATPLEQRWLDSGTTLTFEEWLRKVGRHG